MTTNAQALWAKVNSKTSRDWTKNAFWQLALTLSPMAVRLAPTPETSAHTSFEARIDQCAALGQLGTFKTVPGTAQRSTWNRD